jgi:hypothetical protein
MTGRNKSRMNLPHKERGLRLVKGPVRVTGKRLASPARRSAWPWRDNHWNWKATLNWRSVSFSLLNLVTKRVMKEPRMLPLHVNRSMLPRGT